MAADLKLLGSVGDLYCFSNTYSMLVSIGCKFLISDLAFAFSMTRGEED